MAEEIASAVLRTALEDDDDVSSLPSPWSTASQQHHQAGRGIYHHPPGAAGGGVLDFSLPADHSLHHAAASIGSVNASLDTTTHGGHLHPLGPGSIPVEHSGYQLRYGGGGAGGAHSLNASTMPTAAVTLSAAAAPFVPGGAQPRGGVPTPPPQQSAMASSQAAAAAPHYLHHHLLAQHPGAGFDPHATALYVSTFMEKFPLSTGHNYILTQGLDERTTSESLLTMFFPWGAIAAAVDDRNLSGPMASLSPIQTLIASTAGRRRVGLVVFPSFQAMEIATAKFDGFVPHGQRCPLQIRLLQHQPATGQLHALPAVDRTVTGTSPDSSQDSSDFEASTRSQPSGAKPSPPARSPHDADHSLHFTLTAGNDEDPLSSKSPAAVKAFHQMQQQQMQANAVIHPSILAYLAYLLCRVLSPNKAGGGAGAPTSSSALKAAAEAQLQRHAILQKSGGASPVAMGPGGIPAPLSVAMVSKLASPSPVSPMPSGTATPSSTTAATHVSGATTPFGGIFESFEIHRKRTLASTSAQVNRFATRVSKLMTAHAPTVASMLVNRPKFADTATHYARSYATVKQLLVTQGASENNAPAAFSALLDATTTPPALPLTQALERELAATVGAFFDTAMNGTAEDAEHTVLMVMEAVSMDRPTILWLLLTVMRVCGKLVSSSSAPIDFSDVFSYPTSLPFVQWLKDESSRGIIREGIQKRVQGGICRAALEIVMAAQRTSTQRCGVAVVACATFEFELLGGSPHHMASRILKSKVEPMLASSHASAALSGLDGGLVDAMEALIGAADAFSTFRQLSSGGASVLAPADQQQKDQMRVTINNVLIMAGRAELPACGNYRLPTPEELVESVPRTRGSQGGVASTASEYGISSGFGAQQRSYDPTAGLVSAADSSTGSQQHSATGSVKKPIGASVIGAGHPRTPRAADAVVGGSATAAASDSNAAAETLALQHAFASAKVSSEDFIPSGGPRASGVAHGHIAFAGASHGSNATTTAAPSVAALGSLPGRERGSSVTSNSSSSSSSKKATPPSTVGIQVANIVHPRVVVGATPLPAVSELLRVQQQRPAASDVAASSSAPSSRRHVDPAHVTTETVAAGSRAGVTTAPPPATASSFHGALPSRSGGGHPNPGTGSPAAPLVVQRNAFGMPPSSSASASGAGPMMSHAPSAYTAATAGASTAHHHGMDGGAGSHPMAQLTPSQLTTTLYVTRVPPELPPSAFAALLRPFGTLNKVRLYDANSTHAAAAANKRGGRPAPFDPATGVNAAELSFSYAEFADLSCANSAVSALDKATLRWSGNPAHAPEIIEGPRDHADGVPTSRRSPTSEGSITFSLRVRFAKSSIHDTDPLDAQIEPRTGERLRPCLFGMLVGSSSVGATWSTVGKPSAPSTVAAAAAPSAGGVKPPSSSSMGGYGAVAPPQQPASRRGYVDE